MTITRAFSQITKPANCRGSSIRWCVGAPDKILSSPNLKVFLYYKGMKWFLKILTLGIVVASASTVSSTFREVVIKNEYGISGFSGNSSKIYGYIRKGSLDFLQVNSYNVNTGGFADNIKIPNSLKEKSQGAIRLFSDSNVYLYNPLNSKIIYMVDIKTNKLLWSYEPTWDLGGDGSGLFIEVDKKNKYITITPIGSDYISIDTNIFRGEIDIIDFRTGKLIKKNTLKADYKNYIKGYPQSNFTELHCDGIIFSEDGSQIIYADTRYLNFIDVKTLEIVKIIEIKNGKLKGVNFNPAKNIFISGFISSEINNDTRDFITYPAVFDLKSGKMLYFLKINNLMPNYRLSPNGRMAFFGVSNDSGIGSLWFWDIATGKQFKKSEDWDTSSDFRFSPDSSKFAYKDINDSVHIWHLR